MSFGIRPILSAAAVSTDGAIDDDAATPGGQCARLERTHFGSAMEAQYALMTFGIKIDGTLTVEDDTVKMEGSLPFAAMMFKGKISDSIRVALEKAIAA